MGISLNLIFFSIALFSLIVIYKTTYHHKRITCMTGMMIAMALGMSAGLIVGVIIGILFTNYFFIATTLSMLIGVFIGFLAGMPISLMAVLDGLLSGLMDGMLGAMLGEMIPAAHQDTIVKIIFFLFLGTLLILIRLINQEVNKQNGLNNPLFALALFVIYFIAFELFNPIFY